MSKRRLATEFVEKAGVAYDDAVQLIDEIGEDSARKLVRDDGRNIFSGRGGQVLTGTALAGGSAVGWRTAGAWDSSSDAQQADTSADVVETLLNSDLDDEQKERFMALYAGGGAPEQPDTDDGGFPDLGGLLDGMDSVTIVLLLLVVLAIIITTQSDGATVVTPSAGGLRGAI